MRFADGLISAAKVMANIAQNSERKNEYLNLFRIYLRNSRDVYLQIEWLINALDKKAKRGIHPKKDVLQSSSTVAKIERDVRKLMAANEEEAKVMNTRAYIFDGKREVVQYIQGLLSFELK